MWRGTIGAHSLHEENTENGEQLIQFAATEGLVVASTLFLHKDIHKMTWKSPDGRTNNQIDHILVSHRFCSSVLDVRSWRGADVDTDHYLICMNMKIKLKRPDVNDVNRPKRFDTEKLKASEVKEEFLLDLYNRFEVLNMIEEADDDLSVNNTWNKIKQVVTKAAEVCRYSKVVKETWFNDRCEIAVMKRKEPRIEHLGDEGNEA